MAKKIMDVAEEKAEIMGDLFDLTISLFSLLPEQFDIDVLLNKETEEMLSVEETDEMSSSEEAEEIESCEELEEVLGEKKDLIMRRALSAFNVMFCQFMDDHYSIMNSDLRDLFSTWKISFSKEWTFSRQQTLIQQAEDISLLLPEGFKICDVWSDVLHQREIVDETENPEEITYEVLINFNRCLFRFMNDHCCDFVTIEEKFLSWKENYSRLEILHETIRDLRKKESQEIIRLFPSRTVSMVSTLSKIESYVASLGIKDYFVVLQAGALHLKQFTSQPEAERDLTPLYRELSGHKAVILLPQNVLRLYYPDEELPDSEDRSKAISIENLLS
ncbi:MAG: hypothetical protein K2X08_07245 [Chlamydiales bacterium]|nr:hypothetical protein [Chlamydiales bacterium]